MTPSDRFDFLLRMGDSTLVLAQRLSEWVGKGPVIEEDIALTNVGLDLIGQARMWLSYAGEVEARGRDEDALAFRRDAHEFRNALLVEQPNGDYAETMARQFLFDHWHLLALKAMERSRDERVVAIAAKSSKEVAYHVERRSTDWDPLATNDVRTGACRCGRRPVDAAGELFRPTRRDAAREAGVGPDLAALAAPWRSAVGAALVEATLATPTDDWAQRGGRQGRHTEHLGHLLTEMQFLQRAYPDAKW
jgi:ring-1,2-phenylacetyl-CoA epoxidase subunit PaaC